MIELEKTYLAKYLPQDLFDKEHKTIRDMYIPGDFDHPVMRLRQNGDKYEITKKVPVDPNDRSRQHEYTIPLEKFEFDDYWKKLDGKKVLKERYYFVYEGVRCEVDLFLDDLKGLVVIDFEFEEDSEKDRFEMPKFCLADVTEELFIAGGFICGKVYSDIQNDLDRFGYKKLDY